MGRITIYTKDDCTYCDEVHECLRSAAKEALDGIDDGKEGEPNIEVFFGSAYAGDCSTVADEEKHERLVARLRELALDKDTSFPPPPDAALVKVTKDMAFSATPTSTQIAGLKAFGFASVLNVGAGPDRDEDDDMFARVKGTGLVYQRVTPCADSDLSRAAEVCRKGRRGSNGGTSAAARLNAARGVTGSVMYKTELGAAIRISVDIPSARDALLEAPESGAGGAGGSDSSGDDDKAGVALEIWNPRWAKRALRSLHSLPKPVLVVSQTGLAACAVALLRAAIAGGATAKTLFRWGKDLGHDLEESRTDLGHALEEVLAEAAAAPRSSAAKSPTSDPAVAPAPPRDAVI